MNIDLHCHSNTSDGLLDPGKVVERAADNGVEVLALTDHDDTGGLAAARAAAVARGISLVNGVEISVSWQESTLHVVGLRVDPDHVRLRTGLEWVRSTRMQRAERIGEALGRAGVPGSLAGALEYVHNAEIISRTHFARFLVEHGYARDVKNVFQRYLTKGKPGYVEHRWAELGDAVSWIRASGGVAVIAHPGRYDLDSGEMKGLIAEFKACGGEGIEVVTGSHTPTQYREFAGYARQFDLLASRGSDFHGDAGSRADLGVLPPLPQDLKPVWHDW